MLTDSKLPNKRKKKKLSDNVLIYVSKDVQYL